MSEVDEPMARPNGDTVNNASIDGAGACSSGIQDPLVKMNQCRGSENADQLSPFLLPQGFSVNDSFGFSSTNDAREMLDQAEKDFSRASGLPANLSITSNMDQVLSFGSDASFI